MNEEKAGKIIDRIVGERIVPEPRWRVALRFGARWAIFAAVLLLSAVALSVASLFVFDPDLDIVGLRGRPMFRELLHPVILSWALLWAGFLALAFWGLRKTRKGYRFPMVAIVGIPVLLVAALAVALTYGDVGERIDRGIGKRFESYESHERFREKRWSDPERGMIGGTVRSVTGDTATITGFSGESWTVRYDEGTSIRPSVSLQEGEKIRVVGDPIPGDGIQARDIRPWNGQSAASRHEPKQIEGDGTRKPHKSDGLEKK